MKIFCIIGLLSMLYVLVPIVLNSLMNTIPYSFTIRERIDNEQPFQTNLLYGNSDRYYHKVDDVRSDARKVYEETGLQLYYVSLLYTSELQTKQDSIEYVKKYIDDVIADDCGVYFVSIDAHEFDRGEYSYKALIHDEVIYGDKAVEFMDSDCLSIYEKAYNKYYSSIVGNYYVEECFA